MVIEQPNSLNKLVKHLQAYYTPVKDTDFMKSDAWILYNRNTWVYNDSFPVWREERDSIFEWLHSNTKFPDSPFINVFKIIKCSSKTFHIPKSGVNASYIQLKGKGNVIVKETKDAWTLQRAAGVEDLDTFAWESREWTRLKLNLNHQKSFGNKWSHIYVPESIGGLVAYVEYGN